MVLPIHPEPVSILRGVEPVSFVDFAQDIVPVKLTLVDFMRLARVRKWGVSVAGQSYVLSAGYYAKASGERIRDDESGGYWPGWTWEDDDRDFHELDSGKFRVFKNYEDDNEDSSNPGYINSSAGAEGIYFESVYGWYDVWSGVEDGSELRDVYFDVRSSQIFDLGEVFGAISQSYYDELGYGSDLDVIPVTITLGEKVWTANVYAFNFSTSDPAITEITVTALDYFKFHNSLGEVCYDAGDGSMINNPSV